MASSTEWRIIWQDDFMGAAGSPPSPERWKIVTGRPWAGGIETDSSDPVHLSLNGEGQLRLTATHDGDDRYTAAWIETSRDDFLPPAGGALRIEARVKTAAGLGLDCALWAWGSVQRHSEEKDPVQRWYRAGETDIFEVLGSDPAGVYGVIHSPTCKGHPTLQLPSLGMGTRASTPDNEPLSADYHTYSIVWRRDPDSITWYPRWSSILASDSRRHQARRLAIQSARLSLHGNHRWEPGRSNFAGSTRSQSVPDHHAGRQHYGVREYICRSRLPRMSVRCHR